MFIFFLMTYLYIDSGILASWHPGIQVASRRHLFVFLRYSAGILSWHPTHLQLRILVFPPLCKAASVLRIRPLALSMPTESTLVQINQGS